MTYRRGSLAVQRQVGVREAAEHVGRSVGSGIREVAAAFLAQQPFLVVGAADEGAGCGPRSSPARPASYGPPAPTGSR